MIPPALEPRRQDLPRQGSRGPVPDRARREAAARVDRGGRLAGGLPAPVVDAAQEPREARVGRRRGRDRRGGARDVRVLAPRAEAAAPGAVRDSRSAEISISIDTPRISPDGRLWRSTPPTRKGRTQIWIRPLNALVAQPLAGTEGTITALLVARQPVLGFFAERKAEEGRRRRRTAHQDLRRTDRFRRDLEPRGRSSSSTARAPTRSSACRPRAERRCRRSSRTPRARKSQIGWPEFLPDGRHFIYMAISQKVDESAYRIGSLDSNETKAFAPGADDADLCAAGLPAVRARSDARRAAVRREGN